MVKTGLFLPVLPVPPRRLKKKMTATTIGGLIWGVEHGLHTKKTVGHFVSLDPDFFFLV
jgi:hypothetical protein